MVELFGHLCEFLYYTGEPIGLWSGSTPVSWQPELSGSLIASVADPDRFGPDPDPDPTSENIPDPDSDPDPVKTGSGFI